MHSILPAVIIPTYNEAGNISQLVESLFQLLPQVEVVVVDDLSPDGTAAQVQKLQKKHTRLHLVLGKRKGGRGKAVQRGFVYALRHTQADIFIEMDADGSHRPQELPTLLQQVADTTVVLASRYVPGGSIVGWPWYRHLVSKLSNRLIAHSLSLPLKDNTNGFRLYPRAAIQALVSHTPQCSSYLALSESAVILQKAGFQFVEHPTIFPNRVRGKSNTTWRELMQNLVELFHLRRRHL